MYSTVTPRAEGVETGVEETEEVGTEEADSGAEGSEEGG